MLLKSQIVTFSSKITLYDKDIDSHHDEPFCTGDGKIGIEQVQLLFSYKSDSQSPGFNLMSQHC